MTTKETDPEIALSEEPEELPDRAGDVTVAVTPRQMAFLALIAALILAILRRVFSRRAKRTTPDAEG